MTENAPDVHSERRASTARAKAYRTVAWAIGIPVTAVAAFVLFVPLGFMEFRLSVLLKLGAGIFATIVLAAGLMAASFYSDASGMDDTTEP